MWSSFGLAPITMPLQMLIADPVCFEDSFTGFAFDSLQSMLSKEPSLTSSIKMSLTPTEPSNGQERLLLVRDKCIDPYCWVSWLFTGCSLLFPVVPCMFPGCSQLFPEFFPVIFWVVSSCFPVVPSWSPGCSQLSPGVCVLI